MVMKSGTKTITFRIPEEMYNTILVAAQKEERSVNNFITYAVKEYIHSNHQELKNKGRD